MQTRFLVDFLKKKPCLSLATLALLALPLALLHARAGAEILIAIIDICFLAELFMGGHPPDLWRQPFAWAASGWWGWLVICSLLGTGGLLGAILCVRLPLLALALGTWLLAPETVGSAWRRSWLWRLIAAAGAWIALESWQQYLLGANIFGDHRFVDGALTGPFDKPRAGPGYILVFFPALLPAMVALRAWRGIWGQIAAIVLALCAVATMILIGQRMPTLLMVLGLVLAALKLRRLRGLLVATLLGGMLLIAALPILSPPTYHKLVIRFGQQISHFWQSPYGLLYAHAASLVAAHPLTGLGFDGFRRACRDVPGLSAPGIPATASVPAIAGLNGCSIHPHNFYLEAAVSAGLPGLALFIAMAATALLALARGRTALQAGLFVGAVVALWPVASTSAFTSMPNSGWLFLVLGFGMACRTAIADNSPEPGGPIAQ